MLLSFSLIIFIIGLLFGSFATVLITRWRTKEGGIFFGRSKCPKCNHTLSWYELFPLFSYVFLFGRCRKCRTKIPLFYPLSELIMGTIFLVVSLAYIKNFGYSLNGTYILLLFTGFITGVYILSDIRYMEIPDEIMVPGIVTYGGLLLLGFFYDPITVLFFDRTTYISDYSDFFQDHLYAALLLYTFLFLQILIPASIQLAKKGKWNEIGTVILSYFTFFYYILFPPKDEPADDETIETWVGGGDLRIALFIGITLGLSHGIFAFFLAYMIGSLYGIVILIFQGSKGNQVPFGPFLGMGWCISLYFHSEIMMIFEYYKSLF